MKTTGLFTVLILFIILLSSCTQRTTQEHTHDSSTQGITDTKILLGNSAALTGHASFLGTQYLLGAQAYFNSVNDIGGVYGRKIEVISLDDQYDPPQTVTNTQKLINEYKVFALFNFVGTPTSVKVKDFIHESEIPAIGFFTGAEELRTPRCHHIFHIRDSYYDETEAAIHYFVDEMNMSNIAVMYQKDAFGIAVLKGVQYALQRRNMETTITSIFERGTLDVEKAASAMGEKNLDVIIMVGTYSPLAKFIGLIHKQNQSPYFYTVSFVGSEQFATEITQNENIKKEFYDKIIVTQVVPSPFSLEYEGVREYQKNLKKYYPEEEVNFVSLEGYINAKIIVEALEKTGKNLTANRFIEELENIKDLDVGIGKPITLVESDSSDHNSVFYSRLTNNSRFELFNVGT